MFVEAYKRAFGVLKSKPIRLWGLSLLVGVISIVSVLFSLWFLPVGIAFCMVIECGMATVSYTHLARFAQKKKIGKSEKSLFCPLLFL